MKLTLDDRLKHRLIGSVVIISLAVIFVPALMKKSNYRLDKKMNISVQLPKKPLPPAVIIPDKKAMFQTTKVARVNIPTVDETPKLAQVVKAKPISSTIPTISTPAKGITVAKTDVIVKPAVKHVATTVQKKVVQQKIIQPIPQKQTKEIYAIQLASFSNQNNAQTLVARLRTKGYKASYTKFKNKQGDFYKVIVGQLNQKEEAQNLQKKLAETMQLNGLIIKTGVS